MSRIPVFVISLRRRQDRRAQIERHFGERGVPYDFVDAVDAREASAESLGGVSVPSGPLGDLGSGNMACTASHVRALRKFLAGTSRHALILEDDAHLSRDVPGILEHDGWIPDECDLVKVEKRGSRPSWVLLGPQAGMTPSGRGIFPMRSRHTGSAGYVISRRGATRALERVGCINVAIDQLLFNATVSSLTDQLNPMIVVPGMVSQSITPAGSDIASLSFSARPTGARQLWRKLKRGYYEARLAPRQLADILFRGARIRRIVWQESI